MNPSSGNGTPPTRILLVEDEPLVSQILAKALQDAGYEVGTATNGLEGLKKFQDQRWDLVITDRAMPVMNGEDMAAAIKALSANVQICLITGFPHTVRNANLFDAFLGKPFRKKHLLSIIANLRGEAHPAS